MQEKWWKKAVGYQIYPRSFSDSNNDGIGDLRGIINKLDYINSLGVNLIWVSPFYQSPMDDNGYDVSDYYKVDPIFGTLEDAKELIAKAHEMDIKVILDLVLNHSSDEHPWFIESRSNKNNPKRNYYIWQKGRLDKNNQLIAPTNWGSFFEGSAWNYDDISGEYYMKIFSNKMPDFNWDHKPLREDLYKIANWWLDQGVDGFRMDAIAHLARDLTFTDSQMELNAYGVAPDWSKFSNREEVFDYIHEFHSEVLAKHDCMSVGEVGGGASVEDSLRYAGYDANAFNMVFNFDSIWQNNVLSGMYLEDNQIETNVLGLKKTLNYWIQGMKDKGWLPQYWLNHDHPRVMSQYGNAKDFHRESGALLGAVLLCLPGTPFIYNGEEIGMTNLDYDSIDDFKDVWVKKQYQEMIKHDPEDIVLRDLRRKSRDNARTPMQWSDAIYAGFSTHEPNQKCVGNYQEINVAKQDKDKHSILNAYRKLINLRRFSQYSDILIFGEFKLLYEENPDVMAYIRSNEEKRLLIVANFRARAINFNVQEKISKIIYTNTNRKNRTVRSLKPFEVLIAELN